MIRAGIKDFNRPDRVSGTMKVNMVHSRGAIKDFNLPDRVSGALKILPDISKIYRTFPKSWHIYLVAYNFFMNHPCDIIQTLNNINI